MAVAEWVADAILDGSEDEIPDEVLNAIAEEADPVPEPGEIDRMRTESLEIIRDLLLQTHPNAVHDLIRGETLEELLESVPAAEAIFAAVATAIDARGAAEKPPLVPAGGTAETAIPSDMRGDALIRAALARR